MKPPSVPSIQMFAATLALLAVTGCKSIGPGQVAGDRFDYSTAIGESWKRQTLLNIVKLRYLDPPIFVDVGQIIASRSISGTVNLGGELAQPNANRMAFGAAGTYTDQPTVTYIPLTGNKFIRSMMTPLPPESVFHMIQSGWPADTVMFAALSSINGLKNESATAQGAAAPHPDFLRALTLMRKIQIAGGVALRVEQDERKKTTLLLALRRPDITPETKAESEELRRLLRVDQNAYEFKLVLGSTSAGGQEIAVLTRSIFQLMGIMAADVEVPAQDLVVHSATPGRESMTGAHEATRMMKVHSSKTRPPHPFVEVRYRDHWFWVDDYDLSSKRSFTFMMLLFTLADTGDSPPPAMVTIPSR